MALSDHDQTRLREYLLGNLTEEEQQQIEERLMVEDALFEELEISKGELIDANYLRRKLGLGCNPSLENTARPLLSKAVRDRCQRHRTRISGDYFFETTN